MVDKYDLYVQGVPEAEIASRRFITRRFNRTAGVRGMDKLIVRWLHVLLTPKGTDPTNLDRGTEYTRLIGSNIVTANDVRDVVVLSIQDCNNQIFNIQRVNIADSDETLRNAVLEKFVRTTADRFDVTVNITNAAGQALKVLIPNLIEGT